MNERPQRKGVMLAVPADEKKILKLGERFYLQPKLNGERCIVSKFHGKPLLLSSYEDPFSFLDKIRNTVEEVWKAYGLSVLFDGEIYKHGWEREKIHSACSRTVNYNPDVEELEYHIFDIKAAIPQGERLELLKNIFNFINQQTTPLKLVPTYWASPHTCMKISDRFLQDGYEGSIFRNPTYPTYEARRLTNQLLKYKPTEIDEYEILDVEEAISKNGEPLAMVGAFIVQGEDLNPFRVGAGKLTHIQRKHYWIIQSTLKGMTLVTKQGKIKTTNGIPTCAVAVEVKEAYARPT